MLHKIGSSKPTFSARERAILIGIAEAAMPAGRFAPGGGAHCVEVMDRYVAELGHGTVRALRGVITAVDAIALARHLRGFASLGVDQRLALLEGWRTGNYMRRTAIQAL